MQKDDYDNRRRYKRTYFTMEDGINGLFCLADNEGEVFKGNVMNLSGGGLGITASKDETDKYKVHDVFKIIKIKGNSYLGFLDGLYMETKWVLDHDELEHYGYGCEFGEIDENIRDQVINFVNNRSQSEK
ncbi:MAG: PilZ domain-containing protein [Desulfobacterales bacterium]|nr:PilZ domain-containing protein [Desulfobacterales bacterium]